MYHWKTEAATEKLSKMQFDSFLFDDKREKIFDESGSSILFRWGVESTVFH